MSELIDLILDIKIDIDEFFEDSLGLLVIVCIQVLAYMIGFIVAVNGDKELGMCCIITLFIIVMLSIKIKDTVIFMRRQSDNIIKESIEIVTFSIITAVILKLIAFALDFEALIKLNAYIIVMFSFMAITRATIALVEIIIKKGKETDEN